MEIPRGYQYNIRRISMRKRIREQRGAVVFAALLAAATSFSVCQEVQGAEEIQDQKVTSVQLESAPNPNMLPTTLFDMTATAIPTQPSVQMTTPYGNMYRSELTNEWIDIKLQKQRPVAIMVDNEKTALPHYGLTEADVVYEMMNSTANGRITRLMALVKDWEKITRFGNVRSTRSTNVLLAAEWNAVLCHDGGPFYINTYLSRDYSANLSGGFSRINNGKAREFTEYISAGELNKRFQKAGYSKEYNAFYQGEHFNFSDTEIDLSLKPNAIPCTEIALPFPHNQSKLVYNAATKTYDYYEYGKAHVDPQHNNAQLTFKNLLIQDTTFSQLDRNGYMIYNVIDTGRSGYYITNGKAIEIVWAKVGENTPTIYFDKLTGEQLQINTGKTYIALVPSDTWANVAIK